MTQFIKSLGDIERSYKGLVVDLWGVMHNGKALFPEAVDALRAARAQGKSITLLSNAPRRRDQALATLTGHLGLSSDLFDDLVTSGEAAWDWIQTGGAEAWGTKVYFLGAGKDTAMQTDLPSLEFVEDLAKADWILNLGPEPGTENVGSFETWMHEALSYNLPMVCANPDLLVMRGVKTEICAGAIARMYAERGGYVEWFGKPHAAVYAAVYDSSGHQPDELLAVGDSFKTDIKGASNQGMMSLFVGTGIHGAEVGHPISMARVQELSQELDAIPTYAADLFAA